MPRRLHSLLFGGLLAASAGSFAGDLQGSHDLDILPRFPRSEIVDFNQASSQERTYPQGSISRISGRLRMEGEVRAIGELTAVTYRLPDEDASQSAFAAARKDLLKADATPLFWCESRDCGSSSLLANAVFGGTAEYVAGWLKAHHAESVFYGYVGVVMLAGALVAARMRNTNETSLLADE